MAKIKYVIFPKLFIWNFILYKHESYFYYDKVQSIS